jgi:hypothetical protein
VFSCAVGVSLAVHACAPFAAAESVNGDGGVVADGGDVQASSDASGATEAGAASESGADGSGGADGGADACAPSIPTLGMGGKMTAFAAAKPPKVDGDLSDWACVPFYSLTGANAQSDGYSPATISGAFALQWTSDSLFVAVSVNNGAPPSGNNSTIYDNPSVELYFGQDDSTTGTFRTNDRHYIVDYVGDITEFRDTGAPVSVSSSSVVVKTKTAGSQYFVELHLFASALGQNTLPNEIPFDVQINQAMNGNLTSKLIWYLASSPPNSSTCTANQELFCNSYFWGRLKMNP